MQRSQIIFKNQVPCRCIWGILVSAVTLKDKAAVCWCENATELTGKNWNYLKVSQGEFEKLKPDSFRELQIGLGTH